MLDFNIRQRAQIFYMWRHAPQAATAVESFAKMYFSDAEMDQGHKSEITLQKCKTNC